MLSNSANVNSAIEKISNMHADMGSTNIYKALSLIFSDQVDDEYPRSLFLITDGGEENSMYSMNLIKNNATKCRIHGFGIQTNGREAQFIQDAAKLGKGCASFIDNIDELGGKIVSSLIKCALPCMNKWEINWHGQAVPETLNLGSIYYGERFIQYILMDNIPENLPSIKYFDTYKKCNKEIAITHQKLINGDEIFKLWAKNKINDLKENANANQKEIIDISIKYQVPSLFTAFICIKENLYCIQKELKTIRIYNVRENM